MNTQKLTTEEFISRCKKLYGNLYSYDNVVYINLRSKIQINCMVHGLFSKGARSLLQGVGCNECNIKWKQYIQRSRMTTQKFIEKATLKHNGFYSYDNVVYTNSRTSILITCPIHGSFSQKAGGHLEGYGCHLCADKKHGDYRPWFIKTYFDRFPEKKNIPATLYLLYSKDENFYKIGITTKEEVSSRTRYMSKYKFEIIDTVQDTMYNVAVAEQQILKTHERYKPKKRFGGHSECLTKFVDIHQYIRPK
jgi:hypothetical protein